MPSPDKGNNGEFSDEWDNSGRRSISLHLKRKRGNFLEKSETYEVYVNFPSTDVAKVKRR